MRIYHIAKNNWLYNHLLSYLVYRYTSMYDQQDPLTVDSRSKVNLHIKIDLASYLELTIIFRHPYILASGFQHLLPKAGPNIANKLPSVTTYFLGDFV